MKDEEHPLDPQLAQAERIAYLIAGFLRRTLTPQEHDELDAWVEASPENMQLFEELTDEQKAGRALEEFQKIDTSEGLRRLHQKIHADGRQAKSPRRFSNRLLVMAAAAVVVIAVSSVLLFSRKSAPSAPLARQSPARKAFLSTTSGDTLWLDGAADGNLTIQGNTQVVKTGTELSYQGNGHRGITESTVGNTLATKRGGQYSLILPDGTRAWLNAASSLSFPSSFTGHERRVSLVGEAYFEVAKDATRPFQLLVNSTLIEVTGTRFNVNAYGDEALVRISLINGSLRVVEGGSEKLLRTGDEADVEANAIKIRPANLMRAVGWHNDRLVFANTSLPVVARELSRWYDVDIAYRGQSNLHLTITIDRNLPLERVMRLLEGTGNVHFNRTPGALSIE